jgi:outer membrane protein assembly factor BamB
MRSFCRFSLSAATVCAAGVAATTSAQAAVPAVAYQLDRAHSGASTDAVTTTFGPKRLWMRNLGGGISYPLIVGNRIYVTAANGGSSGSKLYALNATTGKNVWGPKDLGGSAKWSGLAFDAGKIFTVNADGVMTAFAASDGALRWSVQLPGQSDFSSPPTARGGLVYTGGSGTGGTLYAVNETTGAVTWSQPVENGDNSSPAVSSHGVWVSYTCGQTYDFNPASGALIWHRDTACHGAGGKTPVLAHGLLYVRDKSFPAILRAATGHLVSAFRTSGPAPAVDASQRYDLQDSTLTATSLTSGSPKWSFTGDGTLDSAPVVAGSTVLIGASSGRFYALSASNGSVLWSRKTSTPIPAPDEANDAKPLTGLGTSGGMIVVPAGSVLNVYK